MPGADRPGCRLREGHDEWDSMGAPVSGLQGKTMVKARSVVAALAVVLSGCAPTQASAQSSFGFRFEASMCNSVKLDTFTGTVTRTDRVGDPTSSLSVPLSLTPEQMRTVQREVERIRFFDYPEAFRGVPSDLTGRRSIHPAFTWRLEVLDGVVAHAVTWQDSEGATTPEAVRLRELFVRMLGFIHDRPAWKALPASIGGCE